MHTSSTWYGSSRNREGKRLRVPELPEGQPQDNLGGPASGSGIKRPATDPPEDPRLEPDPSGTQ